MISYDPSFGYELAVIIRDGIRRMYTEQEDIFYYLTVYNENYAMPALPEGEGIIDGIIKGAYCYRRSKRKKGETINLLSSGAIMQQAIQSAESLEESGYRVNIWSVTSFIELEREAQICERWNRLHPTESPKEPYIKGLFKNEKGVFVAVTDYMKSLPNSIARWMPEFYTVLGTDGYGLSESRDDIRDYFEVSSRCISQAAISLLYRAGHINKI